MVVLEGVAVSDERGTPASFGEPPSVFVLYTSFSAAGRIGGLPTDGTASPQRVGATPILSIDCGQPKLLHDWVTLVIVKHLCSKCRCTKSI